MSRARTVGEARERLARKLDVGTRCPCCRQFAKRYRRKLNSGMAASLCWLVDRQTRLGEKWVETQKRGRIFSWRGGTDFPVLRHWGLIEPLHSEGLERSGFWRATKEGLAFARGKTKVRAYAVLYNNTCAGLVGRLVTIREALGARFNYSELMRGDTR